MSTYGYDTPGGPAPAPPPGAPSGEQPPPPAPGPRPTGTPPSGPAQYDPTAVLGRRIGAWLVDALLIFVVLILFSPFGQFGKYVTEDELANISVELDDGCDAVSEVEDVGSCLTAPDVVPFLESDRVYYVESNIALLGTAAVLALVVLIWVVWQGVTGSTPGKQLFKLRVVDEQGGAPGMGRALLRTALWLVDGAPWVVPAVGFVLGVTSTGHRRVGDMAARTFVVAVTDTGRPVQVPGYFPGSTSTSVPEYRLPQDPPGSSPAFGYPPEDFGTSPLPGVPGDAAPPEAGGEPPSATDQFGEPERPALDPLPHRFTRPAEPGPDQQPVTPPAEDPPVDTSRWVPSAPEPPPAEPPAAQPLAADLPTDAPPVAPETDQPSEPTGAGEPATADESGLPGWAASSATDTGVQDAPDPAIPDPATDEPETAEPGPVGAPSDEVESDGRPPPPVSTVASPTLEPGRIFDTSPAPEPPEPEPVAPAPEPGPEAELESEPGAEPEPESEPEAEPDTELESEPGPEPAPEPELDLVPEPEAVAEPELGEPEPEPEQQAVTESEHAAAAADQEVQEEVVRDDRPPPPVIPPATPTLEPRSGAAMIPDPQPAETVAPTPEAIPEPTPHAEPPPATEPTWPAQPAPAPEPEPQPMPTYQPQWDPARGTYILWEPLRNQWLQWNTSTNEWVPL